MKHPYLVGPDQSREYQPRDHHGVVFATDGQRWRTFEDFCDTVLPWCDTYCAGGHILDHFIMWFEREDDAVLCLLALA